MEVYTDGYVCRLRILRYKYGISARELAQHAGISFQYVSSIELCQKTGSAAARKRITDALQSILQSRLSGSEENLCEFHSLRSHLFDKVKESEVMMDGK